MVDEVSDTILGVVVGLLAALNVYCVWQIIELGRRIARLEERKSTGGRRKDDW